MRTQVLLMGLTVALAVGAGCTRIESIEPQSGPPGVPVYIKCSNMYGDPAGQVLKWDGEVLRDPFPGSFTVPGVEEGGTPGVHKVTLVDKLDLNEGMLWFPMLRGRRHTVEFVVTEP